MRGVWLLLIVGERLILSIDNIVHHTALGVYSGMG